MYSDIAFSKIYKNKNYYKLYESNNDNSEISDIIINNSILSDSKIMFEKKDSYINFCCLYKLGIYDTDTHLDKSFLDKEANIKNINNCSDSIIRVLDSSLKNKTEKYSYDEKSNMLKIYRYHIYVMFELQISYDYDVNDYNIIPIYNIIYVDGYKENKDLISQYFSSYSFANKNSLKKLFFNNKENIMTFKPSSADNILDANIINSHLEIYSNDDLDLTDDVSSIKDTKITLAKKKDGNCNPMIYPKNLVSSGIRSVVNNTQMLLNSVSRLNTIYHSRSTTDALYIPSSSSKKESNRNYTIYDYAYSSIKDEKTQLIENLISSYESAFNLVCKNSDYNSDYSNSDNLNSSIQVYLPEILAPYAICDDGCTWNQENNETGLDILKRIIGISSSNLRDIAYIEYNTKTNTELADATIYFNFDKSNPDTFKKLSISVKGGANGKGASASINTFYKYIFDDNGKLTYPLGQYLKTKYNDNFTILSILLKEVEKINDDDLTTLKSLLSLESKKNNTRSILKDAILKIKNNSSYTDMILDILKSLSYDFIQINAIPSSTSSDFHLKFTAQYPAIFKGKIDIEILDKGNVKFHIV